MIAETTDLIGVVLTPSKDVWRVTAAVTEAIRVMINQKIIGPPTVIGSGFPPSSEGKEHFERMNGAATNTSRYIRPSKAVTQLTPTFTVLPSPKVLSTEFVIPCKSPGNQGYVMVPFEFEIFFECDRDFEQKLTGAELIVTWHTKGHKYGLISQHVHNVLSALGTIVVTLATHLDGIGYFSVDDGTVELKTQRKF